MTETFKPIFTITNRITSGLTRIERARGFLEAAILSEDSGRTIAFLLAPAATREPRENTNFYALYFGLCHGVETGRMAARDWRGVAASQGYAVPRTASRTVVLTRPEEVTTLPP